MIARSAASPSVSAAGPGCRIKDDSISCSAPHWTAAEQSNPGLLATFCGRNFLPHVAGAAHPEPDKHWMRGMFAERLKVLETPTGRPTIARPCYASP
jgi:hypothetical protein